MGERTPELVSCKKIWDAGGHNAFTDLIYFDDQWFCTFRESAGHVAGNGKIRVITSKDGEQWKSAVLLVEQGADLRDPKLSITPNLQLMLTMGGTVHDGAKILERQSRVAFSKDGFAWSAPERVLNKGDWLWRTTWHDALAYGTVYNAQIHNYDYAGLVEWGDRLVESKDGVHFRTVANFNIPGRPNEATARFLKNGDCVVLIRREAGDKQAWIGTSHAPYTNWHWSPVGLFIGGPDFIVLKDGSMIVSGRRESPGKNGVRTFVGRMDLNSATPELNLPAPGKWDCSYPGLVWAHGLLWISYYSSHEGKASIYLAKVRFR